MALQAAAGSLPPPLASPRHPRWRWNCVTRFMQIGISEHAWFEASGETRTPLAFIGEGTSRLIGQALTSAQPPSFSGRKAWSAGVTPATL